MDSCLPRCRLLLFALAPLLLPACRSDPSDGWASDCDRLARVEEPGLAVLFEPGSEGGRTLAPQVLEFLREAKRVARDEFGVESDVPVQVVLREGDASSKFAIVTRRDAQSGGVAWRIPLPVRSPAALARDLSSGGRLRDAPAGELARARQLALLDVHEMLHALISRSVGPGVEHLWLNEGLAELLAYRTGVAISPRGAAEWLRERLGRLKALPQDATVDLLRWSLPGDGSERYTARWVRGEEPVVVEYAYDDPASLRAAAAAFRSIGREEPADGRWHEARAAILEEMADVAGSPRGATELDATSDDEDSRFDVYAVLLAFMIELEGRCVNFRTWLLRLASGARPCAVTDAEGNQLHGSNLMRTNREVLGIASEMTGEDLLARARRYPVAEAVRVLARALAEQDR